MDASKWSGRHDARDGVAARRKSASGTGVAALAAAFVMRKLSGIATARITTQKSVTGDL